LFPKGGKRTVVMISRTPFDALFMFPALSVAPLRVLTLVSPLPAGAAE